MASILSDAANCESIIPEYVSELTAGSLQSAGALNRVASALNVSAEDAGLDFDQLNEVFDVRNRIIHELDINLNAPRRKRNHRGKVSMIGHANALLQVAENILKKVEARVSKAGGGASK